MKKIFILLMIFVILEVQAQNYRISFAGKGAGYKVDSVKVENLTQCTDTALSGGDTLNLEKVISGINEISNSTVYSLHIYPNPMTGYCLIDFNATAAGNATLELYDIAGKRIAQLQELLMKGQQKYNLSGIGSGIYVLKVESNQYEYSAKIVSYNSTPGIAEISHFETALVSNFQPPASDTGTVKSLKGNKSSVNMQYNTGDILKLTGFSGIYSSVFMLVAAKSQTDTFNFIACTDADSNHYTVVQIGTQTWMEENLKTTTFNDDSLISLVTDNSAWQNLSTPAYCWYTDSVNYKNIYGALYNWYAVSTGKICPKGWHVPDTTEWNTLINYLGGINNAGAKMKEVCSTHWYSSVGATNSSGFTALPGGDRGYGNGAFGGMGNNGFWWSASVNGVGNAWGYYMFYGYNGEYLYGNTDIYGFSVRCVKDQ